MVCPFKGHFIRGVPRSPQGVVILALVKITQLNQSHTNTQESFVHKVCQWWGEPFEKKAMSSLARELKILVSVVRFRPGPPRFYKPPSGGFFIWSWRC